MHDAWLLLPDLTLIACGYLLCRYTALNRPLWEAVEKLVYYLLFPVLLFSAVLRNPIRFADVWQLALSALVVVTLGIALAYALRLFKPDRLLHASGAQVAFRFNSYVMLAMAERLGGTPALALAAVLFAVAVPLANVGAVWPLARHGGQAFWRELARNPLIIATLGGLLCNLLGLKLPELATTTLARMGAAALPLGLMAVGAGLRLGAVRESPALAAGLLAIRHLAMPAAAIGLCLAGSLPPLQQSLLVAFAAMPTAASCYVLAVRMGGNGPYVAALVTLSTGIGMVGLPLALAVLRALAA
jgi:malonate transporter and related proteins